MLLFALGDVLAVETHLLIELKVYVDMPQSCPSRNKKKIERLARLSMLLLKVHGKLIFGLLASSRLCFCARARSSEETKRNVMFEVHAYEGQLRLLPPADRSY